MDNDDLIRDFLKDIELRGWSKWTVNSCKYSLNLFNESIKGKLFRDVNKEELKDFLIGMKIGV